MGWSMDRVHRGGPWTRVHVLYTSYSQRTLQWAIALNFCTPGVEEQWNSSGVSYKSCGILQGLSQKSWNSLGDRLEA